MAKQSWQQWVRSVERDPNTPSKLRKGSLAALTGQDTRALNVFVAALELYAVGDDHGRRQAVAALEAAAFAMQQSTRWIARELIPYVLEWGDRERLWGVITEEWARSHLPDDDNPLMKANP